MDMIEFKRKQMEQLVGYRNRLRESPRLRWLFFELTSRCNLRCRHCGSSCTGTGDVLSINDVYSTLDSLGDERPMICLTGGEPLMHPQFFEIATTVRNRGFFWGMTTNATMIGKKEARMIREAGMSTVSISLDGMEEMHDDLRQIKGAWRKAVEGIKNLQSVGYEPQVTTVFHSGNIGEIENTYQFLRSIGVKSWRPINVEPIGRACESSDMLLKPNEFKKLISFIRSKRFDPTCEMRVTFGCSHFLGYETERMVRDHYFFCSAGILVAAIRSNGDICGCLDIENRPELAQGNIHQDDFWEVWKNRYHQFRQDRTADSDVCRVCAERFICAGDSMHTWDFDNKKPLLCGRDFME